MPLLKFDDLYYEYAKDPENKKLLDKYDQQFDFAIMVSELRHSQNLTQREFAEKVDKPQSTIARIENGNMMPSLKLMQEIGKPFKLKVKTEFVVDEESIKLSAMENESKENLE